MGTAIRAALESAFAAAPGAFPWVTFAINVLGSLLLGALLGALGPRKVPLRLALGTGLLGGFTTYSTFIVELLALPVLTATAYALGSVLAGVSAAWLAFSLVSRRPTA